MCDCVNNISEKIKTEMKQYKGKDILQVDFPNKMFPIKDGKIDMCYYSEFELEIEGRKRRELLTVANTFCPFCGEKQRELNNKK